MKKPNLFLFALLSALIFTIISCGRNDDKEEVSESLTKGKCIINAIHGDFEHPLHFSSELTVSICKKVDNHLILSGRTTAASEITLTIPANLLNGKYLFKNYSSANLYFMWYYEDYTANSQNSPDFIVTVTKSEDGFIEGTFEGKIVKTGNFQGVSKIKGEFQGRL